MLGIPLCLQAELASDTLISEAGILDGVNPALELTYPAVSDTFTYLQNLPVQWVAHDSAFNSQPIILAYYKTGSDADTVSLDTTANDSLYEWIIPEIGTGYYQLKITAQDSFGNASTTYSDSLFIIGPNPDPNWYIAPYGNDTTHNGTPEFPYATIQKALNMCASGDSIYVLPGRYSQTFSTTGKNAYIQSSEGFRETFLSGDSSGYTIITINDNTTLKGFTIMHSGGIGDTAAIRINGGAPIIRSNRLLENQIGILCTGYSQPRIKNNFIGEAQSLIKCQGVSTPTIENNTLLNGVKNIEINSGTVTLNAFNNIITGASQGGIVTAYPEAALTVQFNDIWNNSPNYAGLSDLTDTLGNISQDPQFIYPETLNVHLNTTSPAINSGDTLSSYFNEPEPNGDRINMGYFGNTSEAAVAKLSFQEPMTTTYEDSLYDQSFGIPPDSGVYFQYTVHEKPSWLQINADSSGIAGIPDNQSVGQAALNISVKDNYARSDTLDYQITVLNSPPVFGSEPDTIANEDMTYAYDANSSDEGQGHITYTLLQNPLWLAIDDSSGLVSGTPANDDVGIDTVTIQVNDGNGGNALQTYLLQTLNVNDPPVLQPLPQSSNPEDQPLTVFYSSWFDHVTDVDDVIDSLSWDILPSSHATAQTTPDSAIIIPSRDWFGQDTMTVVVYDHSSSDTNQLPLEFTPVNDAPRWHLPPDTTMLSTDTLTLLLNDYINDVDDSLQWLQFDYDTLFQPDDYDLEISLASATIFKVYPQLTSELEAGQLYFYATDTSLATATDSLLLSVNKVNFPPILTPLPEQIGWEDSTTFILQETLLPYISDPDDPLDSLTWSINGTERIETRIQSDSIFITPLSNWFGHDTLTLTLRDETAKTPGALPVYIQNVPDPPVISMDDHFYVNEDETLTVDLDDYIEDIDTPDSVISWQVNLTSFTHKNCCSPAGKSKILSNSQSIWDSSAFHYDLNTTARHLQFYGDPNYFVDSVRVFYRALDTNGLQDNDSNYVTILPVNDQPDFIASPDTNFMEDSSLSISDSYWLALMHDIDDPDSLLSVSVRRDSGLVFHQYRSAQNSHYFWANRDVDSLGYFTLLATDPHGAQNHQNFIVDIIPVNDPPTILGFPDTSAGQDSLFNLPLLSYIQDPDDDFPDLAWEFKADTSQLIHSSGSDTLQIAPPLGYVGRDTISVILTDTSGLSDQDTFLIRFYDTSPPEFSVGIFQNPVASEHLDFYFFSSEQIDSVLQVTINKADKEVVRLEQIEPAPFYCHHQVKASTQLPVYFAAYDTMGNLGQTDYTFTAGKVMPQTSTLVYSPDSLVAALFPAKSVAQDQFVLCLPQSSAPDKIEKGPLNFAKIGSLSDSITYQFTAPELKLKNPVKISFTNTQDNWVQPGIYRYQKDKWCYQTTYTDQDRSHYWIYTDQLSSFRLGNNAPQEPVFIPQKLHLAQNYPNPFNAQTTIEFHLPEASSNQFNTPTRLIIYDLLGRQVIQLINRPHAPGIYTVQWYAHNRFGQSVASGVYIYTLEYGKQIKTRKLVLIK